MISRKPEAFWTSVSSDIQLERFYTEHVQLFGRGMDNWDVTASQLGTQMQLSK